MVSLANSLVAERSVAIIAANLILKYYLAANPGERDVGPQGVTPLPARVGTVHTYRELAELRAGGQSRTLEVWLAVRDSNCFPLVNSESPLFWGKSRAGRQSTDPAAKFRLVDLRHRVKVAATQQLRT